MEPMGTYLYEVVGAQRPYKCLKRLNPFRDLHRLPLQLALTSISRRAAFGSLGRCSEGLGFRIWGLRV